MLKKTGTGKIEAVGVLEPKDARPLEKCASIEALRAQVAKNVSWQPVVERPKDEN